jgi:hypothetical protein
MMKLYRPAKLVDMMNKLKKDLFFIFSEKRYQKNDTRN